MNENTTQDASPRTGPKSLLDDKDALVARINEYIENHTSLGDIVPTVAGLACEISVGRRTLQEWAAADDVISRTLELLKAKQERLLASGGLGGTMNPTITKLMLSNHGYSDKVDNTSSDGSMTPKASSVIVTSQDVESIISKI